MSTLTLEWGNLDRMFQAMDKVGAQSVEVETYFSHHVCDKSGFDYDMCALKPIADQIGKLGGFFSDMQNVFEKRWDGVIASVAVTAKDVDRTDGEINLDFSRYTGGMGPYAPQTLPELDVDVELFTIDEITDLLEAPGDGTSQLKHDKDWVAISEGYDGLRDTINAGVDQINGVGAPGVHLPRLSEKSLEDYIVYPLAGNFLKIQGNSTACSAVNTAMTGWGSNFSTLSGKVGMAMKGDVEVSMMAHLMLYDVVMKAVGQCIGAGSQVFDAIAVMSEEIAVAVEKALVVMGKTLLRVSTKIATRVLGWLGWAVLVKDLFEQGMSAITDIYDDVVACIDIITACFDLVDTIKAWAHEQASKLETFQKLVDIMGKLPTTSLGGSLDDLPPIDVMAFEKKVGQIDFDFTGSSDAQSDLDDELSGLDDELPEVDSGDETDDGEVLMAPGPMPGTPGYEPTPPPVSA